MLRTPYKWNTANFKWNDNAFTWDDCALITDIVSSINAGIVTPQNLIPDKKKKKQFIKLLCKIQGKPYEETKQIVDTRIFIKDIELVAKEVLGINIKIDR